MVATTSCTLDVAGYPLSACIIVPIFLSMDADVALWVSPGAEYSCFLFPLACVTAIFVVVVVVVVYYASGSSWWTN